MHDEEPPTDDLNGLVPFLLARLTEDEGIALAAADSDKTVELHATAEVAVHVTRHDPDRVLRDVAGKRAIVALWKERAHRRRQRGLGGADILDAVVAQLAATYAKHADFKADWLIREVRPDQFGPEDEDA